MLGISSVHFYSFWLSTDYRAYSNLVNILWLITEDVGWGPVWLFGNIFSPAENLNMWLKEAKLRHFQCLFLVKIFQLKEREWGYFNIWTFSIFDPSMRPHWLPIKTKDIIQNWQPHFPSKSIQGGDFGSCLLNYHGNYKIYANVCWGWYLKVSKGISYPAIGNSPKVIPIG